MRDVATSDEAQLGGWTAPSFEQTSSRKFQHKQEARADASQPHPTCSAPVDSSNHGSAVKGNPCQGP